MKKITFLILHYITIEDTKKCIESIKNLKYKNKDIVVVDNGSSNNTGIILQDMYKNDQNIHVILSKNNLGFANGNNLGFKYIKDNLNSDFIVMINNDVYMIQEDFCNKIVNEYEKSSFAVLGPKIILRNNIVSDYPNKMKSLKEYKKLLKDRNLYYNLNKYHLRYVYSVIFRLKKIFNKKEYIDKNLRKEDALLNGCALIFSKNYIDKFVGLDNRTFLYFEEQLLYLRLKKNNLLPVYNPELVIFHNEGVSTNKSIKNERKKVAFKLENEINSLKILIKELEQ